MDRGVAASPIPKMLGTKTDRAGRALVDPFLMVVDTPGVFVVGDAASVMQKEHPVPGVAQAAIQEGRYVGRLIASELKGQELKRPVPLFRCIAERLLRKLQFTTMFAGIEGKLVVAQ